jgi:hypothetical protein
MTPTEEAVVLVAGTRYFDFPEEFRAQVESLFLHEQPAGVIDVVVPRPRAPLSDDERRFGAFLAVAKIMSGFRREIDALEETV